jgi:hypothetical protein
MFVEKIKSQLATEYLPACINKVLQNKSVDSLWNTICQYTHKMLSIIKPDEPVEIRCLKIQQSLDKKNVP